MKLSMKLSIAEQIRKGTLPQGYELTENDIGASLSYPTEGFGAVLIQDIGKRVWLKSYGLVMENNEQRDKRKNKFEVTAGRNIYRDNKPFIRIENCAESYNPCELDELTHIIAALLNRLGNKEIKTTYLEGLTLKLR
jgi:hypothetical protein